VSESFEGEEEDGDNERKKKKRSKLLMTPHKGPTPRVAPAFGLAVAPTGRVRAGALRIPAAVSTRAAARRRSDSAGGGGGGYSGSRNSAGRNGRYAPARMVQQQPDPQAQDTTDAPAPAVAGEGEDQVAEAFWEGELICADCGFVYDNRRRKKKFEDLPDTWVCPQCNAPKRRFARKVGDFVEQTAGTSNTPIIVFSIAGLLLTVLFGIWANKNL
jgi:rubredoxin